MLRPGPVPGIAFSRRSWPLLQATTVADPQTCSWQDALSQVPEHEEPISWIGPTHGWVAWGVSAHWQASTPQRWAEAQQWWDAVTARAIVSDAVNSPGTGLIAAGSFPYSARSKVLSELRVPRTVVGYSPQGGWRTTMVADPPPHPLPPAPAPEGTQHSEHAWEALVERAVETISQRECAKVVLARSDTVAVPQHARMAHIVASLAEQAQESWTFSFDGFVGSTPEMLVSMWDRALTSRVLAGTLPRTDAMSCEEAHAQLRASSKDQAEHGFAVQSVVETVKHRCSQISVSDQPYVLDLPHVHHLASIVQAQLLPAATAFNLLNDVHPSAAVCGTPRTAAAAFIAQHEGLDRGRYAGPIGWIDHRGNAEWGLALRCGHLHPSGQRATLYAGGGIMETSQPLSEYAETEAKFATMRHALTGGNSPAPHA